jgi:hypothetical protein
MINVNFKNDWKGHVQMSLQKFGYACDESVDLTRNTILFYSAPEIRTKKAKDLSLQNTNSPSIATICL